MFLFEQYYYINYFTYILEKNIVISASKFIYIKLEKFNIILYLIQMIIRISGFMVQLSINLWYIKQLMND